METIIEKTELNTIQRMDIGEASPSTTLLLHRRLREYCEREDGKIASAIGPGSLNKIISHTSDRETIPLIP